MYLFQPKDGPPYERLLVFEDTLRLTEKDVFEIGEPVWLTKGVHGYEPDHAWWIEEFDQGLNGGLVILREAREDGLKVHKLGMHPTELRKLPAMVRIAVEARE